MKRIVNFKLGEMAVGRTVHKRVPAWVRNLPDGAERAAITRAIMSIKSVHVPFEVLFVISNIKNRDDAHAIELQLQLEDWRVTICLPDSRHDDIRINANKDEYLLNKYNYVFDKALFNNFALEYGIAWQGWIVA